MLNEQLSIFLDQHKQLSEEIEEYTRSLSFVLDMLPATTRDTLTGGKFLREMSVTDKLTLGRHLIHITDLPNKTTKS